MRIAINCRSFSKKTYAGIGRYAYNLVKSLGEIDSHSEYLLYAPKKLFDPKRRAPQAPAPNFTVKLDYFNRGLEKTLGKIDLYHAPSPEALSLKGVPVVVRSEE